MKVKTVSFGLLAVYVGVTSLASAQPVDCSLLDPRVSVSREKEAKISGSAQTLYRIAKAGGSVEARAKEQIQNLTQGIAAGEQDSIKLRTLYIFCGMVANAKD